MKTIPSIKEISNIVKNYYPDFERDFNSFSDEERRKILSISFQDDGDDSESINFESILDNSLEVVQEVRFEDFYGEEFVKFRKKYNKIPYKQDYYVQFTNHSKDVLEKNPHQNPDHHDPIGVYGYPLEYVLKNPSDIWYGSKQNILEF